MAKKVKPIDTPNLSVPFSTSLMAEAIRARRTQLNLGIVEAAKLSGISKQTLSNIEQDVENVHFGNICKVMKTLGISISINNWSHGSKEGADDDWY